MRWPARSGQPVPLELLGVRVEFRESVSTIDHARAVAIRAEEVPTEAVYRDQKNAIGRYGFETFVQ